MNWFQANFLHLLLPRFFVVSFALLFGVLFLSIQSFIATQPANAAFPVVEATNGGGNTTAAVTTPVTLPSNVAVGNLLIVFFVKDGTAAPAGISGTGWTTFGGAAGTAQYAIAYWKIADGDDALTINHASTKTAYIAYRITGHDANTAPEIASAINTSITPNPPALNPTNWETEQTLWLASFGWDAKSGNGAALSLSSYSPSYDDSQTTFVTGTADATDVGIAVASRNAYLVSDNPGQAALSGSGAWVAHTVAIRPLATSSVTYSGTLYTDNGSTTAGAGEQVTVVVQDGETFTKLSNPGTLPTGISYGARFSPDGTYLSITHATTPFVTIYKRSGDTFTKLANPSTLPTGTGWSSEFSPDGAYLAVTHTTSPYVTIYKRDGDTFTKLPNPTSLPTGTAYGSTFTPDGLYLAIAHNNTPFITIYKRDGDTFTKLSNPSTLPAGNALYARFSPDGVHLAVSLGVDPYFAIYKRDGDTFTKLADPSGLPSNTSYGSSFSPDGRFLAVTTIASRGVIIFERSGDTFTRLAALATGPQGEGERAEFSPDMRYLIVSHELSPFVSVYRINGSTFTKLPNPGTLPVGKSRASNFSPDGKYVAVAHESSPFVTIYRLDRQNITATDTTDGSGDWSVNITLSTTSPSTNVPAMAFVSSGTTTATTIFTDVVTPSVRTSIPLYGGSLLVHGTTSTTSVNRYYYYDSDDNARVLYTATSKELVVTSNFVNATNTTMEIPANYTLSVAGDVEQRGNLRAGGSTFNFNGTAGQVIEGGFTGSNSLGGIY